LEIKNKEMKNKQFEHELNNHIGADLDSLLSEISVMTCEEMIDSFEEEDKMYNLNTQLKNWFAVVNSQGIIAYFEEEAEAYKFRLDYISRIMNY
jgi:hypothetical protein